MATKGTVSGVIANMVTLVVDGPVAQNEICYISTGGDKLMAEVIKVVGTLRFTCRYLRVPATESGGRSCVYRTYARSNTGARYAFEKLRRSAKQPR